jgi:HK97 gp10 family phage protein
MDGDDMFEVTMSSLSLTIDQKEISKCLEQVRFWQVKKQEEIEALIEKTAEAIADDARRNAPASSGKMKDSIKVVLNKATGELGAHVVADVFYARFVELGEAPYAGAQPFLHPAYEAHIKSYLAELKRIVST